MATNMTSPHFLDLPTEILLAILGRLPATSIILRCRLVCRRMNRLSRTSHLWAQYLNWTRDVSRPPLDQKQIGTIAFERTICQTETLKKIWCDESTLQAAPRFWRGAPCNPETSHGTPVGIMGEYMILERRHEQVKHSYTWVCIQNQNGPVIFSYDVVSERGIPAGCYVDPSTHTFYVAFIEASSLVVMGFQANVSGPHKAFKYHSRLRNDMGFFWLWVQDGFVYVQYYGSGRKFEVDVINLRKQDVSRFSLPAIVSFLPGARNNTEHFSKCIATDAHLICVVDQWDGTGCVVFRRPTTNLHLQSLDLIEGLLGKDVHLGSAVIYNLPDTPVSVAWVVACSLTSFAIVQICRKSSPSQDDQRRPLIIRVLSLTILDGKVSIQDIGSATIPGLGVLKSSFFPLSRFPVRYALGVLAIWTERAISGDQCGHEYFALKIDFPSPEQSHTLENKCQIVLTKMCLAPVVDVSKEETVLNYFDNFSGKIVLSVSPPHMRLKTGVVIDYLSTAME